MLPRASLHSDPPLLQLGRRHLRADFGLARYPVHGQGPVPKQGHLRGLCAILDPPLDHHFDSRHLLLLLHGSRLSPADVRERAQRGLGGCWRGWQGLRYGGAANPQQGLLPVRFNLPAILRRILPRNAVGRFRLGAGLRLRYGALHRTHPVAVLHGLDQCGVRRVAHRNAIGGHHRQSVFAPDFHRRAQPNGLRDLQSQSYAETRDRRLQKAL